MDVNKERQIFDVEFARKQFPYFELENSAKWAFFDNAGGTFPCRFVLKSQVYPVYIPLLLLSITENG